MALVLADRVQETCNSPGTGTVTLLGAQTGYQAFSAGVGNGNTCFYAIADQVGANWEVGVGTYSSSGNTFTRTTVLSSSNGGSLTNFSSGVQNIWVDYPAKKSVNLDVSGKLAFGGDSIGYADWASASPTVAAGRMWYDGSSGSWNLGMGGGNITQQVGEEIFVYGKASAAITDSPLQIIKQTAPVGSSGVIGFAPTTVGITDGNLIIGCATESLALNAFGRITSFGVIHGITTNGTAYGETWADGDTIWYNPVTGNPTNVKPSAPNIKVSVGKVINAGSGGSGSFQVEINHGSVLGGTDSNVQLGTPTGGQILTYNQTSQYWSNVSLGAGTGFSATASAGGALSIGASVAAIGTWMGTPSSANLAAAMTDETGSGSLVFATSPTLVTPILGTPQSGNFSTGTFTWPTFNQNTTGQAGSVANSHSVGTGLSGSSFNGSAAVSWTLATAYGDSINPYASKTANYVLAAPNGVAGVPSFRALVSADVPALSYVSSVSATSPVASSGGLTPTISLSSAYGDTLNPYASKTANYFLAAPNGSAGTPSFRAIVAADIPTLNQNTTGTAANVTGIVAIANGGTNSTATPTSGGVGYGTGSAHAYTAAGTANQVLISGGASAPSFTTLAGSGISEFASGTALLFQQTAAPTGWTKATTSDNAALRIVSGTVSSGGTVAFTTAFSAANTVDGTAISVAQLPVHSHGVNDPGHNHNWSAYNGSPGTNYGYNFVAGLTAFAGYTNYSVNSSGTGISIQNTGSGSTHNHTLGNLAVKYVDAIICTKN